MRSMCRVTGAGACMSGHGRLAGPILMTFDCGDNLEKMSIIGEESIVRKLKGRHKILLSREGGGGERRQLVVGKCC